MVHPLKNSRCEGSDRRSSRDGPSEDRHSIEEQPSKKGKDAETADSPVKQTVKADYSRPGVPIPLFPFQFPGVNVGRADGA